MQFIFFLQHVFSIHAFSENVPRGPRTDAVSAHLSFGFVNWFDFGFQVEDPDFPPETFV
jgi:hypothetical protein